jgi:ribosomal protein S12 methylthiotransferase
MVSLGCPKNQVDGEILLNLIVNEGFELTNEAGLAEVVIVNTCGFIESAKQESIDEILELCELKKEGRIKCIVVTGCLAERYKQEVFEEIPEIDVVLGIGKNSEIVSSIKKALSGEKSLNFGKKEDLALNGDRVLTTLPFYAYIKVAEGCDNCCSYCAIPLIRGKFRSRKIEDVISEAKHLVDNGVRELILVAQDTTRYGEDLYGKLALCDLLNELCKIEDLKWIRLLYCYPDRITDELLDTINSQEKIVKYLDIPLQHVNSDVLKAMNRTGDVEGLTELIEKIRQKVKGITLRTTFITGFPNESEQQFCELMDFAKNIKFDRLGCFAYSAEEDTPAFDFEGQIEPEVKQRRAELIMNEQMTIMENYNNEKIGKTLEVVVEGFDKYAECYFGRSSADAPDIDGKVFFRSKRQLKLGEFVQVFIEEVLEYDLMGVVV